MSSYTKRAKEWVPIYPNKEKKKKKVRETSEEQSSWVVGDVDIKEDTSEQE